MNWSSLSSQLQQHRSMDWLFTPFVTTNTTKTSNPLQFWGKNQKGHAVHKPCDYAVKRKTKKQLRNVCSPNSGKEYDLADVE